MNGGVAGARGGAGEGLAAVGLCYRGGMSVWRQGEVCCMCGKAARRMAWVACRIIVGVVGDAMLFASDDMSQIRPKVRHCVRNRATCRYAQYPVARRAPMPALLPRGNPNKREKFEGAR